MSFAVNSFDVSIYLSIMSKSIMYCLFDVANVLDGFSTLGFIKSTCPNVNSCSLLVLCFPSDLPDVALEESSVTVPALILILAVPLYSKKDLLDCLEASSQLSRVSVYLISFKPVVVLSENVGVLKVFLITVFAFSSPSTVNVISSVVNVLLLTPVRYLSVATRSAVTLLFVLSILIFSTFHTGSTTSTMTPVLSPSSVDGSSIPTVIVFAIFLFPDLSVNILAGNAIVIIPL